LWWQQNWLIKPYCDESYKCSCNSNLKSDGQDENYAISKWNAQNCMVAQSTMQNNLENVLMPSCSELAWKSQCGR